MLIDMNGNLLGVNTMTKRNGTKFMSGVCICGSCTVQITFIFIGVWQPRLHLCNETLKRVSNFSELA